MRKLKNSADDLKPLLNTVGNMSKDSTDPFYTVKDNINSQVEKIKIKNDRYLDFVKNNDTSQSAEYKELRKGLVTDLRKAEKDLKGLLQGAIDMVEKNRAKFPHIKDAELDHRRRIVDDMQNSINDVKTTMESPLIRRKLENDENRARSRGADGSGLISSGNNNAAAQIAADNTSFIKTQSQVTRTTIDEQDRQLDSLGNAVTRLTLLSGDIKTELVEQDKLLDNLQTDMDDAGNRMEVVMASLNKLLKSKDGCQIGIIVTLAIILIILVALTIWV